MDPQTEPVVWQIDLAGYHTLTVFECRYPEAVDGGYDLPLTMCQHHARTVYWCLDRHVLWCDGGPPDYNWHECVPVDAYSAEPPT